MSERILKDFETFEEFPNSSLLIDNKSNIFYLKKDDETYIVKEQLDSCVFNNDEDTLKVIKKYYNVINGNLITTISKLYFLSNNEKPMELNDLKIYIESLKSILKLKDDEKYYLSFDDVKILTHFKDEKNKEYSKK